MDGWNSECRSLLGLLFVFFGFGEEGGMIGWLIGCCVWSEWVCVSMCVFGSLIV